MRCPLLRLAATQTPWGKHGTPNSHWGAISTGSALWRFTPSSPFSSLLQRTTRSRCGICRRRLLPKSKNVSKRCLSNSIQPWLIDSYWPEAEQFQICIDFLSGPSCSALSDTLILSLRCVQFRHFTPDAADRAPLGRKALSLMSPIRRTASVYCQTVTRFSHMKLSRCDKELTTVCSTALMMSHHSSVAHTQSGVMWWVYS